MKKCSLVTIILTAVLCIVGLTACGKDNTDPGNTPESPAPETYTVRFVIDDEVVEEQTLKPGEKYKKPSCDTAKEGYTFDGWMTENGTKVNWNSPLGKEVNADMTITAHYTVKTYTVRIYANGNEIGQAQKVEYGKEFSLPDANAVLPSAYFKVAGYRLNGSDRVYTESTLDKTIKSDTRVDVVIGLREDARIELSGFRTEFTYLDDYEKGADAKVKICFDDGGEYVLSENEYETVIPEDFGEQVKDYTIGIKPTFAECDEVDYTVSVKANRERFSVLIIGNSYSDDTIALAYKVAKSAGIKDIKIADLYIGGCTINTHIDKANGNVADYLFRYFDNDHTDTSVDTLDGTKRTLEYGVTYTDWDWIIFQQGSWASGLTSEYSRFQTLINYVKGKATNPSVKFGFNMTWAYAQNSTNGGFSKYDNDQQTMYNDILNAVQTQVATKSEIEKLIPNGTAVQNARTSFIGDNLTRDNADHLTKDVGRYIAAMTFITRLTGLDVSDITYKPDGLSESYVNVAKESVKNALNKPFEVTQSQFVDESGTVIGERTQTTVTFTQGWYDSTLSNGYELQTGANLLNKFKATQKFTRETLPVGSLIYIAIGWQYRPEGWKNGEKINPRKENVQTQWVEVTEEWWGEYTERAFNISTTSQTDITGKSQSEMETVFKIYIP